MKYTYIKPRDSKSEHSREKCEECHDTGIVGDLGPGPINCKADGSRCDCDPVARMYRNHKRYDMGWEDMERIKANQRKQRAKENVR